MNNEVTTDQVLSLTREIAGIGQKQEMMLDMLKDLKNTMVSADRVERLEKRVENLEGAHHRWLPYGVMLLVSVPGWIALFHHA